MSTAFFYRLSVFLSNLKWIRSGGESGDLDSPSIPPSLQVAIDLARRARIELEEEGGGEGGVSADDVDGGETRSEDDDDDVGGDLQVIQDTEIHNCNDNDRVEEGSVATIGEQQPRFRCSVCYTRAITHILLPCGHISICKRCLVRLEKQDECPTCRTRVQKVMRFYIVV